MSAYNIQARVMERLVNFHSYCIIRIHCPKDNLSIQTEPVTTGADATVYVSIYCCIRSSYDRFGVYAEI